MLEDARCVVCNGYFEKKMKRHIYCSPTCNARAWRKNNPERVKELLQIFRYKNPDKIQEYNERRRVGPIQIPCAGCGKKFHRNNNRRLFCSQSCRDKKYRRDNKEWLYSRHKEWVENNRSRVNELQAGYLLRRREIQPWRSLIESTRKKSAKFGIRYELTLEWGEKNWTGKCAVTGIEFASPSERASKKRRSLFPSIDRIKPELGYVPGNCRYVLWAVNTFKNDGSDELMLQIAQAIVNNAHKGLRLDQLGHNLNTQEVCGQIAGDDIRPFAD